MQVGLLGYGYWGKILLSKLEKLDDVEVMWVYTSQDEWWANVIDLDWVFIATPNDIHYKQAKHFIEQGVNVFCEKPLTPTYKQSKELFDLSKKHNVKLYVSDVFNYRRERNDIKNLTEPIEVTWNKISNNTLYDLMYHDLYLLWPYWLYSKDIKFNYGQLDNRTHKINDIDFTTLKSSNDALSDMLNKVLYGEPNYSYNMQIALYCNKIIEKLEKNNL
tara:strand:- start:1045 stop:1698 length:654 start_codon:yes stop_codon:yes gene_type:complete